MFNDLKTSSDLLLAYRKTLGAPSAVSCELDVSVLTSGFWPVVSDTPCILPLPVQAAVAHFQAFYLAKHSGRRLRWNTLKGSAELRATFGTPAVPRKHELSVSTYQMCVLMLFNDLEELSFKHIQDALGIAGGVELRRHVLSLLNPKCRILEKCQRTASGSAASLGVPSGPLHLEDTDMLRVHTDFSSKMLRVKVPLISAKSAVLVGAPRGDVKDAANVDDGPDIPSQVEETRKHLLEAAIVRTMKTRKTMEHNSLIAEVLKQVSTRFHPSPTDVKKRIEALIDRDYMERDKESNGVYHYLA